MMLSPISSKTIPFNIGQYSNPMKFSMDRIKSIVSNSLCGGTKKNCRGNTTEKLFHILSGFVCHVDN